MQSPSGPKVYPKSTGEGARMLELGEVGYKVKSMYDCGDDFVEFRIRGAPVSSEFRGPALGKISQANLKRLARDSLVPDGALTDRHVVYRDSGQTRAVARGFDVMMTTGARHRRPRHREIRSEPGVEPASRHPHERQQMSQSAWLGQQQLQHQRQRKLNRHLSMSREERLLTSTGSLTQRRTSLARSRGASLSPARATRPSRVWEGAAFSTGGVSDMSEAGSSMTMRLVEVEAENRRLQQELSKMRESASLHQSRPATFTSQVSAEASTDAEGAAAGGQSPLPGRAEGGPAPAVDSKRAAREAKRRQADMRRQQLEDDQKSLAESSASFQPANAGKDSSRISDTRTTNLLREYQQGNRVVKLPEPSGHRLLQPICTDTFEFFDKVHQGCQTELNELDKASLDEAGFKERRLAEMLQVRSRVKFSMSKMVLISLNCSAVDQHGHGQGFDQRARALAPGGRGHKGGAPTPRGDAHQPGECGKDGSDGDGRAAGDDESCYG